MDCPSDDHIGEVPAAAGPGSPEAADVAMPPRAPLSPAEQKHNLTDGAPRR